MRLYVSFSHVKRQCSPKLATTRDARCTWNTYGERIVRPLRTNGVSVQHTHRDNQIGEAFVITSHPIIPIPSSPPP